MQHRVRPVQTVDGVIETHDEHPAGTGIAGIVQPRSENKASARLGRHDEERNGPGKEAADGKECSKGTVRWQKRRQEVHEERDDDHGEVDDKGHPVLNEH